MAEPDVTADKEVVEKRRAYTKVSYGVLHKLLNLPAGVWITSILQQPEDCANEQVRLYLQGEEIAEVEDGHPIPQVAAMKRVEVELVPVEPVAVEPVSP